jgi:ribosomal protein L14
MKPTTPKANKELEDELETIIVRLLNDVRLRDATMKGFDRNEWVIKDKAQAKEQIMALITSDKQRLLQELMEQAKGKAVGYPCVPLSVIQNKLEGLS